MREILFKAKKVRVDNGEWVEGFYHYKNYIYAETRKHVYTKHYILPIDSPYTYEVDPETVCQYTGLTDRAKNKAFENSIIKLISENVFGVVKFGEYRSEFESEATAHIGFYVDWCDKGRCGFWRKDLGYWLNVDTVIVGNIFDNQELLEV